MKASGGTEVVYEHDDAPAGTLISNSDLSADH